MAPKNYVEIASYVFSGKFPAPIPFADIKKARILIADVQIVRPPLSPYFSDKTNPPNGFLGTMCAMSKGFVVSRYDIIFPKQRVYLQPQHDEQSTYMARCFDAIDANRLAVLATALGFPTVLTPNQFSLDLRSQGLFPDELLFVCYADTALSLTLSSLDVLECTPETSGFDTDPVPPPDIPAPVPVPPGQPVPPSVFSPRPSGTNPADYAPFPLDNDGGGGGDFPACTPVTVTYSVELPDEPNPFTGTSGLLAPIGNLFIGKDPGNPGENGFSWLIETGEVGNVNCPFNVVRLINAPNSGIGFGEIISVEAA
jgi:hypothetical protein